MTISAAKRLAKLLADARVAGCTSERISNGIPPGYRITDRNGRNYLIPDDATPREIDATRQMLGLRSQA
jgi:hypothetical protein